MRVGIVCRTDERDVRTAKVLGSLVKAGHECILAGWNRFGDDWQPETTGWRRKILNLPTAEGFGNIRHMRTFRTHVIRALAKQPVDVLVAVNDEVGFLVKGERGRLFRSMVLDIHDELDSRIPTRNVLLRTALWYVSARARDAADAIICTNPERCETYRPDHQEKVTIVANYPVDCGANLWSRIPRGDFRIYCGGALGEMRGLAFLLKAAAAAGVRIVSCGRLTDDYAREVFVRHPAVRFLGCVTPAESLAVLADCHGSVAFYKPGPLVNRLAAPNKVYDALCVGRPILISDETGIADWVEGNSTGYRIRYGDVDSLAERLTRMKEDTDGLPEFARRTRDLFSRGYSWEAQEPVLYSAFERIADRKPAC